MFEGITTVDIITALAALLALVISFWSARISKRNLISTAITSNRIEWIVTVRKLIFSFVKQCEEDFSDKKKLKIIYEEIVLYFNSKEVVYSGLVEAMKKCITGEDESEILQVVSKGQQVLRYVWILMKREAGISTRFERSNVRIASEKWDQSEKDVWSVQIEDETIEFRDNQNAQSEQ